MAIQKTEAVVLKTQPFRSSSLIVTLFSRSFGKLRGIAKGVRLERELRGALYELFTRLDIVFYEKHRSDLHLLSEATILDSYEPMRTRLEPLCYAGYFSELVDQLHELYDPHEKIFDLLDFSFRYLSSLPGERLARLFEIKLLSEMGWLPYLDGCLPCGAKNVEEGFFSVRQGALICRSCAGKFPDARPIEAEALAVMRYYSRHDLEESIKLGLTHAAECQVKDLMERFFLERMGYPLKSRYFIEKVEPVFRD